VCNVEVVSTDEDGECPPTSRLTVGLRARQLWGKVRRYLLVHLAKAYVERQLVLRRGACRRCGSCCALGFRCLHLRGRNECGVYERRYLQCRLFPIDRRDLAEVPGRSCGFWFEDK